MAKPEVDGSKNVQVEEVAVDIKVGVVPSAKKQTPTRLLPVPKITFKLPLRHGVTPHSYLIYGVGTYMKQKLVRLDSAQ